jgi:hypothetical protein
VVTGLDEWPEEYNENPRHRGFDHGGEPLQSLLLEDEKTRRVGPLRYVVAQFLSPKLTYRELVIVHSGINAPVCEQTLRLRPRVRVD